MPTLNRRQSAAFRSTFSVWRAPINVNATTALPADQTYTRASSLNYGLYGYTQNDSDPAGVGRIKRRSALTEDQLVCHSGVDVRDGDIIRNTTSGDPSVGVMHKVQGEPKLFGTYGRRVVNELTVQLISLPKAPSEVNG